MAETKKKTASTSGRKPSSSGKKASGSRTKSGSRKPPVSAMAPGMTSPHFRLGYLTICILLGLYGICGYFNLGQEGTAIRAMLNLFKGLTGWGYLIAPPLLIIAGIMLGARSERPYAVWRSSALLCVIPLFGGVMQLISGFADTDAPLWQTGLKLQSGGVISGGLTKLLVGWLSKPGTWLLYIIVLILLVIAAVNVNVRDKWERYQDEAPDRDRRRAELRAEKDETRAAERSARHDERVIQQIDLKQARQEQAIERSRQRAEREAEHAAYIKQQQAEKAELRRLAEENKKRLTEEAAEKGKQEAARKDRVRRAEEDLYGTKATGRKAYDQDRDKAPGDLQPIAASVAAAAAEVSSSDTSYFTGAPGVPNPIDVMRKQKAAETARSEAKAKASSAADSSGTKDDLDKRRFDLLAQAAANREAQRQANIAAGRFTGVKAGNDTAAKSGQTPLQMEENGQITFIRDENTVPTDTLPEYSPEEQDLYGDPDEPYERPTDTMRGSFFRKDGEDENPEAAGMIQDTAPDTVEDAAAVSTVPGVQTAHDWAADMDEDTEDYHEEADDSEQTAEFNSVRPGDSAAGRVTVRVRGNTAAGAAAAVGAAAASAAGTPAALKVSRRAYDRAMTEAEAKMGPTGSSSSAARSTDSAAAFVPNEDTGSAAYIFPPIDLLQPPVHTVNTDAAAEARTAATRLEEAFRSFGVNLTVSKYTRGPNVTRYEAEIEAGTKLSKLTNLEDDIALALGSAGVRIAAVPNVAATVGIEVPNHSVSTVYLREIIESDNFRNAKSKLTFALGKSIAGEAEVGNISKLPHLLIAGTTGSGKSVCLNSLILSLLYKATPEEVKFIMVDPKMVEFKIYNGIPHLMSPVVTDPKKAAGALQWAVVEMMKRYRYFSDANTRDLDSYNQLMAERIRSGDTEAKVLPRVVIIIDELADLMMVAAKEVEDSICRVAQMGRAAGMHLVVATQSPRADVITGLIKANIPSRCALKVSSSLESRIILDSGGGAEKLIGNGDMLYAPTGTSKPKRIQGTWVSDEEREKVIEFLKQSLAENGGEVEYDESITQAMNQAAEGRDGKSEGSGEGGDPMADYDEVLPQAVDVALDAGQVSVSMLQRRLKLGYSRAARVVDQMEELGVIGPFEGAKPRQVLITRAQWQEMQTIQGTAPTEHLPAGEDGVFPDYETGEPVPDELD